MKIRLGSQSHPTGTQAGLSLVELLCSIAIAAVTISGTVNGYILSSNQAEWSAYSLAANSLAMQRVEQARAAKWDLAAFPAVDQVTSGSFPPVANILDVPISGTNIVYATNFTTVSTISTSPALKMIRVDCVWAYRQHGVFTNTVISYRASDQ